MLIIARNMRTNRRISKQVNKFTDWKTATYRLTNGHMCVTFSCPPETCCVLMFSSVLIAVVHIKPED